MAIINPKTDGNEHLLSEAFPDIVEAFSESDGELEAQGVRFAKVEGEEFRLEAVDPYALWRIKPKHGSLPHELQGTWTSPSEAELAIKAYITARKFKEALERERQEQFRKEMAEKQAEVDRRVKEINASSAHTQSKSISDKSGSKSS